MDERYLNYSHAPIVSPLKKSLHIEMYNDTYFSPDTIKLDNPTTNQPSNSIDKAAFTEHVNPITLPAQLFEESGNTMPESDHTMRPRWYLIQIDMKSTVEINPAAQTNGRYWCMFLATHLEDKKRNDKFSRW